MAQALPNPDQRDVSFTLRLPGWLLITALLAVFGVLAVRGAWAYRDRDDGNSLFGTPARVEVLSWDVRDGVFHARVLVETTQPVAQDPASWQLQVLGSPPQPAIPAAAAVGPAPAPPTAGSRSSTSSRRSRRARPPPA